MRALLLSSDSNLPFKYRRASVLKLNLFQKTVWEVICSKNESPLLTERLVTDHSLSVKVLSGTGSKPKVLSDNWDLFFHEQLGWEPNYLRTKMFESQGLTLSQFKEVWELSRWPSGCCSLRFGPLHQQDIIAALSVILQLPGGGLASLNCVIDRVDSDWWIRI